MVSTGEGHGGQRRNSGEYTWLMHESKMAARISRGFDGKQTQACAAHHSAPLSPLSERIEGLWTVVQLNLRQGYKL